MPDETIEPGEQQLNPDTDALDTDDDDSFDAITEEDVAETEEQEERTGDEETETEEDDETQPSDGLKAKNKRLNEQAQGSREEALTQKGRADSLQAQLERLQAPQHARAPQQAQQPEIPTEDDVVKAWAEAVTEDDVRQAQRLSDRRTIGLTDQRANARDQQQTMTQSVTALQQRAIRLAGDKAHDPAIQEKARQILATSPELQGIPVEFAATYAFMEAAGISADDASTGTPSTRETQVDLPKGKTKTPGKKPIRLSEDQKAANRRWGISEEDDKGIEANVQAALKEG